MRKPRIGLALGSGSARGWAHIGVIEALGEMDIQPDIVTGCSVGSLVGAAYVSGTLPELKKWVQALDFWDIVKLLDVRLQGGLIEGSSLMASFQERVKDIAIEELDLPFAAVATELNTGREHWLQSGSLLQAVRCSIALPGLFSPVQHQGNWLVDGGLVNPVPVSICRALGAEVIIAVNLNGDIIGKHLPDAHGVKEKAEAEKERDLFSHLLESLNNGLKDHPLARHLTTAHADIPGMFEVMASSINIMQDRITKSRMAGDPPDVLLTPRLAQLGLLEFDRADEAMAEGRETVKRMQSAIQYAINR